MTDKQSERSEASTEPEASSKQKGLSKEAWAGVSAIAVALISGIVAIVTTVLPKLLPVMSPLPSGSDSPLISPVSTADAIAHKWTGEAKTSSGQSYTINLEIRQSCKVDEKCGTISVLQVPCYGELYLKEVQNNNYEFEVKNFTSRSSINCKPGDGEHFTPRSDGRLTYRADWGVQGILNKSQEKK